jgi:hypothetical protein
MTEHLTLTFAEIEFMLRAHEPGQVDVREQLGLSGAEAGQRTAAAGIASLLARGLCTRDGDRIVPSEDIVGVIGALATATRGTKALGWRDGDPVLLHLFTGPVVGVVLQSTGMGQYAVAPLDPARDLVDQLVGFVDACLADSRDSAVLVRSGDVRIAVATDADGDWYVSDSAHNADVGVRSTQDQVAARIRELLAVPA